MLPSFVLGYRQLRTTGICIPVLTWLTCKTAVRGRCRGTRPIALVRDVSLFATLPAVHVLQALCALCMLPNPRCHLGGSWLNRPRALSCIRLPRRTTQCRSFGTCDAEAWAGGRIACVPLEFAHVPARSGGDAVIGATACSWSGIPAQMLRLLEAGDPVRAITSANRCMAHPGRGQMKTGGCP